MDIAHTAAVNAVSRYAQADTADAVNLLVLRKAMDMQEAGAMQLLDALPQPPALAPLAVAAEADKPPRSPKPGRPPAKKAAPRRR